MAFCYHLQQRAIADPTGMLLQLHLFVCHIVQLLMSTSYSMRRPDSLLFSPANLRMHVWNVTQNVHSCSHGRRGIFGRAGSIGDAGDNSAAGQLRNCLNHTLTKFYQVTLASDEFIDSRCHQIGISVSLTMARWALYVEKYILPQFIVYSKIFFGRLS